MELGLGFRELHKEGGGVKLGPTQAPEGGHREQGHDGDLAILLPGIYSKEITPWWTQIYIHRNVCDSTSHNASKCKAV